MGICAGGYYGSHRIEFEVGTSLEVSHSPSPLSLFWWLVELVSIPPPLFSFLLCRWLEAVNSVSFPVVLKGEPLSPTNFSPKVMFDPSFAGHIERCSLGLFMRARRDPVQPA